MLLVGYTKSGQRVSIENYDSEVEKNRIQKGEKDLGEIYCAEGHLLIAKRGDVRKHHFCHKNKKDSEANGGCGSDGKTSWHIWWQARLLDKNIEFRLVKEFTKIADSINIIPDEQATIVDAETKLLSIVEFQNSKMSEEEFILREKFYTRTDLMANWGLPYCRATLTWVFNLTDCDIDIDHVFGDIVCFRWTKGSKYMYNVKAPSYWDFGKRDLIEILAIHKPKVVESLIIGRLVPLEHFDEHYFKGIVKPVLSNDEQTERHRLNTHRLAKYEPMVDKLKRSKLIELCHLFYFRKEMVVKGPKKVRKKKGEKKDLQKEKSEKVTKEEIEQFLKE